MRFTTSSDLALTIGARISQAAYYGIHLWESDSECEGEKKAAEGEEDIDEGKTGNSQCVDINTRKYHSVFVYTEDTCCDLFDDYTCKGEKKTPRSARPGACWGGFEPIGTA